METEEKPAEKSESVAAAAESRPPESITTGERETYEAKIAELKAEIAELKAKLAEVKQAAFKWWEASGDDVIPQIFK